MKTESSKFPQNIQKIGEAAYKAIGLLEPAKVTDEEARGILLSTRTRGGQSLPAYYLIYFLLVDLLGFPNLGKWEKVAWMVPVRYHGKLHIIKHAKMGLGIFEPNPDPNATMSKAPSEEAEIDAKEIAMIITKGVNIAEPYYKWRAEQEVTGSNLNVINNNNWLFNRYEFFRDRFRKLLNEAEIRKDENITVKETLEDGSEMTSMSFPSFALRKEANWNAQAAIEAFFSWTEHLFIHLSILQGLLRNGEDVGNLANAEWKTKFKTALDINNLETKVSVKFSPFALVTSNGGCLC